MARIAVDARPLSIPTTGIARYTNALLEHLIQADHEWYLYSDRPLLVDFGTNGNVNVRTGNLSVAKLSSLYAQFKFPIWAARDRVELFWSPRHHLPLALGPSVVRVVTIHDLVWRQFPQTMSRFGRVLESLLMPPSIRSAEAIIAVSEATRSELAEWYPQLSQRMHTVLEAPFLPVSPLSPAPGDYFLFVGTLEPRKNLPKLLRAYAVYAKAHASPLPLKICGGSGWGLPELHTLICKLDLAANIQLLGYVSDEQLPDLYREARALLIPSLYEGFGLPIVEAYSQGTPVVTSNHGAMAEVGGSGALLVDCESEGEIAEALRQLSDAPVLVAELQSRALKRARDFSWDTAAAQTLAIFESLLAENFGQENKSGNG